MCFLSLHGDDQNVFAVVYAAVVVVHEDIDDGVIYLFLFVRTVTSSRLTYVSKLAFQNNIKLQYL